MVTNKKKKQSAILSSGRELFWKYGFRKVSVDEICNAAGCSKMTFYRYYTDKLSLAKAVYDEEVDQAIQKFRNIMQAETRADEKLQAMLSLKSTSLNNISPEFLKDFYCDNDSELKEFITEKTTKVWSEIISDFKEAQQRGFFRQDFKPELLLYISRHISTLINDPYLLQLYGTPHELIMEITRFFTHGIAPNSNKMICK